MPPDADGVLGAGKIEERPFVVDGVLGARPTLRLCLRADAARWNENEAAPVFDTVVEILEEPMLLVFF